MILADLRVSHFSWRCYVSGESGGMDDANERQNELIDTRSGYREAKSHEMRVEMSCGKGQDECLELGKVKTRSRLCAHPTKPT